MFNAFEQERTVQNYFDPYAAPSSLSIMLHDPLQIRSIGLQPQQVMVYEDFGKHAALGHRTNSDVCEGHDAKRRAISSRPSSTIAYNQNDSHSVGLYSSSPVADATQLNPNQVYLSHQDAMDQFQVSRFRKRVHITKYLQDCCSRSRSCVVGFAHRIRLRTSPKS